MLIIPAVDIKNGKCVRLFQGDYEQETVYGEDPLAMAERWVREGAPFLHVVDLDGARAGYPVNKKIITQIVWRSSVPVQVGGGIRNLETIEEYLAWGAKRVIVGTAAITNSSFLEEACRKWPGQIAVDIAARMGKIVISGWLKETDLSAMEIAQKCQEKGAALIIYTDILRDGTQKGINLAATRAIAAGLKIPVIASGGISNLADLEALLPLEKEGVCGVIIGRALYAGTLKLPEALAIVKRG
ncbi:MAG: 1-(5-phosphoribosyl)-5-[(5-phosphoribosylamino)methylideneamino]imidazole-4-carboxamide isomerase [Thermodesulfobacteriota bacterium]